MQGRLRRRGAHSGLAAPRLRGPPLARGSAKDGQARACTPRSCSRLQGCAVPASGRPPGAARGRTAAPEAGGAWPRGIGGGRRRRHAGAAGPPPLRPRRAAGPSHCGRAAGWTGRRGAYVTPPAPAGPCACGGTLEADRPQVPNVHPQWVAAKREAPQATRSFPPLSLPGGPREGAGRRQRGRKVHAERERHRSC